MQRVWARAKDGADDNAERETLMRVFAFSVFCAAFAALDALVCYAGKLTRIDVGLVLYGAAHAVGLWGAWMLAGVIAGEGGADA